MIAMPHSTNRQSHQLRLFVFAVALVALITHCGCETAIDTGAHYAAPVAINQEPPFRYEARTVRMYGGDSFETLEDGSIHFVSIEGISTPSENPFYEQARIHVRKLRGSRLLEIEVIGRDGMMREIAHAYAVDNQGIKTNIALSLLRNGLAWFDHSEGDYAKVYQRAEAKARRSKVGIWAKDLAPPWESWQSKVNSLHELSDEHFPPLNDSDISDEDEVIEE